VSGDTRTSREYNILEADIVRNPDHMEELLTTVLGARRAYDGGDETFSLSRPEREHQGCQPHRR